MTDKHDASGNVTLAYTKSDTTDHGMTDMCEKEGLLEYIELVQTMIRSTYRGVQFIEKSLLKDAEAPGQEQVCFEIDIVGDADEIIEDQRKFYRSLIRRVPQHKRRFFTFT